MTETEKSKVIFAIPYIHFSSFTKQERWSIVETTDRVYFVQADSFASILPSRSPFGLSSAIALVLRISAERVAQHMTDWSIYNLDSVLANSVQYVSILKGYLKTVSAKKRLLGGAIITIPKSADPIETNSIRLKLKQTQFDSFSKILQRCADAPITNDVPVINIVNNKNKAFSVFILFGKLFKLVLLAFVVFIFIAVFFYQNLLDAFL